MDNENNDKPDTPQRPTWRGVPIGDDAAFDHMPQQQPPAADSADSAADGDVVSAFGAFCDEYDTLNGSGIPYELTFFCRRFTKWAMEHRATIRAALRPLSDGDSGETGGV